METTTFAYPRLGVAANRYRPFQSNGIYKLSDQFYRKVGIKNTEEKLEAAYWMKRINPEDL